MRDSRHSGMQTKDRIKFFGDKTKMSTRSKKVKSHMGRALYNSCGSKHEKSTGSRVAKHTSLIEKQEIPASLTILEQTHLEEFVHTTELARAKYASERPEFLDRTMLIVGDSDRTAVRHRSKQEIQDEASRILRKPEWNASMTGFDVKSAEDKAFLEWRRALAELEEQEGIILSPVTISANLNVHCAQHDLVGASVNNRMCHHDHSGAGSKYWKTIANFLGQSFPKSRSNKKIAHRGTFTARNDQTVYFVKIGFGFD